MDFSDQATKQEEMMRDIALTTARAVKPELQPNGFCFNCQAELVDNDTAAGCFCDCDCRDDWQSRKRNR
jgi:hypothetical protein